MVVRGLPSGTCWDDETDTQSPLPSAPTVGVSDWGVLNQLVNLNYVPLIPDGDAKRHKVYTGSGNRCPTSSLRDRSCIPCTEVLIVGGYKLGERGSWSQVSAWCGAGCLRHCSQAAGGACVTECRLRVCESVVLLYVFSPLLELSLTASFYSRKEEPGVHE